MPVKTKSKATIKAKRAIKEMVVNGGNVTAAMRKAGYSENTANTPQKLTESKGFQELCHEMGLTDDLIITSLTEDIKKKPQNRLGELALAAKLRGRLVDKSETISKNLNVQVDMTEGTTKLKAEYEEKLREQMLNDE